MISISLFESKKPNIFLRWLPENISAGIYDIYEIYEEGGAESISSGYILKIEKSNSVLQLIEKNKNKLKIINNIYPIEFKDKLNQNKITDVTSEYFSDFSKLVKITSTSDNIKFILHAWLYKNNNIQDIIDLLKTRLLYKCNIKSNIFGHFLIKV